MVVTFHHIVDVNKTERQVSLKTDSGRRINIGRSSRRLLIGAFFRNSNLNMYEINPSSEAMKEIRKEIKVFLSDYLIDPKIQEVELYAEAEQYR